MQGEIVKWEITQGDLVKTTQIVLMLEIYASQDGQTD